MRSITRVSAALFVVLALASTANAQGYRSTRKARPNLAFRASFVNFFQRGNVDDFFHSIAQDPTRDVDAGSPAYFATCPSRFLSRVKVMRPQWG